jgi:hypothetical protein
MPLQGSIISRMPSFTKIERNTIALLRFLGIVVIPQPLLHRVSLGE